ncbi:MAG: D-glycerate dehydrogenase, partial [Candidatus Colwellbacteria bacterium]|nr:D-glycerate dehydrogenase [Candidatus Colwellbacteria bacterium]
MKIFITRRIPGSALDKLKEVGDVTISPYDRPIQLEELIAGVRDADALLCLLNDHIDAKVMEMAPNLKI